MKSIVYLVYSCFCHEIESVSVCATREGAERLSAEIEAIEADRWGQSHSSEIESHEFDDGPCTVLTQQDVERLEKMHVVQFANEVCRLLGKPPLFRESEGFIVN